MIVPIGVGDGHPRAVIAVQGGDQAARSRAATRVGDVLFVARQVRQAGRRQEATAAIEVGMAAVEGARRVLGEGLPGQIGQENAATHVVVDAEGRQLFDVLTADIVGGRILHSDVAVVIPILEGATVGPTEGAGPIIGGRLGRMYHARVRDGVGHPIGQIGILRVGARITDHDRIVVVQFAKEEAAARIDGAAGGIGAAWHTRRRTVGGPAPVDLFEQMALAIVVLLLLLAAREHGRQRAAAIAGVAGYHAVGYRTGDAAIGQTPAGRGSIGVDLVRAIGLGHLHLLEALEVAVVVVGEVVIVLVAPVIGLTTRVAGIGRVRARVGGPDAGLQIVLVAPGGADPIGSGGPTGDHHMAPVFVVGPSTGVGRGLRRGASEGIVGRATIDAPGVAVRLFPADALVPTASIVQGGDIEGGPALRPQVANGAGARRIGIRTTVGVGRGEGEEVGIVLPLLRVADGDHRRIQAGAVGPFLRNLAQRQVASNALALPGGRINHRDGTALVVGEVILVQEVAMDLDLHIVEHIGAHDFGRRQPTGAGEIQRVITAGLPRGAVAAATVE